MKWLVMKFWDSKREKKNSKSCMQIFLVVTALSLFGACLFSLTPNFWSGRNFLAGSCIYNVGKCFGLVKEFPIQGFKINWLQKSIPFNKTFSKLLTQFLIPYCCLAKMACNTRLGPYVPDSVSKRMCQKHTSRMKVYADAQAWFIQRWWKILLVRKIWKDRKEIGILVPVARLSERVLIHCAVSVHFI